MNVSHLPGGALARSVTSLQSRIAAAQTEATTGRLADPVETLGAGRGETLSWLSQADRLDAIRAANGQVAARLDVTQAAISRFGDIAGDLSAAMVTGVSGEPDRNFLKESVKTALSELRNTLNTAFDGGYILAGTTSDIVPIGDPADERAAMEARFVARFGQASTDPASGAIAAEDLATFARETADWLTGPGWALVSDASPDAVTARIAPGETATISVSADENAFRNGYAAAFVADHLFASAASDAALTAVARETAEIAATASTGSGRLEGSVGLVQARLERTNTRLAQEADALRTIAGDALAVDLFEAAQKFTAAVTQLETAYALTGRLSQLSLMRFL